MKDTFQRRIDYMRISVTDRCNLRCVYCMPEGGVAPIEHKEILRYEEIIRIVKLAVPFGVRNVRLTGGEPLVRKNIAHLIKSISDIQGIDDLSLTTNGILLERYAEELAGAGLRRVN
ncbi:MAG: radical SAM protein, partial [Nitrospirales bacterium]